MVDDSATSTKAEIDSAPSPPAQEQSSSNPDAQGTSPAPSAATSGSLQPCCVSTIKSHVLHNPMMVCPTCKFIIKCFTDEKAYQNYIVFCRSRRRPIVTGTVDGYLTCAFRAYDTFPK